MMRKTIIVSMLIFAVVLSGCSNQASSDLAASEQVADGQQATSDIAEQQVPSDFNFSLSFGIGVGNNIDTYGDTFTKDLIVAGSETIPFVIPPEKMQEIYNMFVAYGISELPDDINAYAAESFKDGSPLSLVTPAVAYELTYTLNQETRTIVCNDEGPWDGHTGPPDAQRQLVKFVKFVSEYIYSTSEYRQMTPASGGYI